MTKLKIIYSAVDSEATGSQRIINPLKALEAAGWAELQVLNSEDIRPQLKWAKLLVLQCLVGPQQFEMLQKVKSSGIPIVIDYDDNFADLPSHVLRRLNLKKEEAAENWRKYLELATCVTVPCQALADKIKKITKGKAKVKILPNCLLDREYRPAKDYFPKEDGSVRILYSCSDSHREDFEWIGPVLKKLGSWYPEVVIISQGNLDFSYHYPDYSGKVEHHLPAPYLSYHEKLREIQPHICIGPLLPNEHAICRSHIKYLQAASIKAAFVGSDLPPYRSSVAHNINGLLASHRLSWFWQLRKLIKDPEYRRGLARNAYEEAGQWLLDKHLLKWYTLYSTLRAS